jgi:1-acyl-sn-glycerol-3-phosphate acyltransferase
MTAENTASDAVSAAKHAARQRAQEARECIDLTVCRAHAVTVARLLLDLPELAHVATVLTYASMPAELDPSFATTALRQRDVRIAYTRIEAPLIPVALDSGRFWARRSAIKRPGTITLAFLPPVPKGLDRRTFMASLEAAIEGESRRLLGIEPVRQRPEAAAAGLRTNSER